ncbi:hypothetical protein [Pseudomonas fluorescens]
MNRTFRWHLVSKAEVASGLLGEFLSLYGSWTLSEYDLDRDKIAVGVAATDYGNGAGPALLVMPEKYAHEAFAWFNVYAPEISPLSQILRVVTFQDWEKYQPKESYANNIIRSAQWACLTLGEILAQGDSGLDIPTIPLSRAQACFSLTVGRTAMIYQDIEITQNCIDRLAKVERNNGFVQRPVTINELYPMWSMLEKLTYSRDVAKLNVFDVIENLERDHGRIGRKESLTSFSGLLSDSVEERVIAFNKYIETVVTPNTKLRNDIVISSSLAAAAFLVGRGTSHLFMLRPWTNQMPLALVWFSFFAAYGGPLFWDLNWTKAVKSIERSISGKFSWENSAPVDLCWAEYLWRTDVFGESSFSQIPKLYPRVLSIEIMPGASCQLRLNIPVSPKGADVARQKLEANNLELKAALDGLLTLASKARDMLSGANPPPSSGHQSSLGFETEQDSAPVTKRGGRSSGKGKHREDG